MKDDKDSDDDDSNAGKDNDGLSIRSDADLGKKNEKNLTDEAKSKIEAK